MTTAAALDPEPRGHLSTPERRPASGGLPARRAILRWTWRTIRRDWREHVLVLGLLSFGIAVLVCGTTAIYNTIPRPEASYGTAQRFMVFGAPDAALTARRLDAARRHFGAVDVIGSRSEALPGSVEKVVLRSQDPSGEYGAPMLRLLDGRYPRSAAEVAVTDHIGARLDLEVGSERVIDGRLRQVVGIVENPADLDSEFVLVAPAHADPPGQVTVLFDGDDAAFHTFVDEAGFADGEVLRSPPRSSDDQQLAAALALAVATVFLVFVSLVAAAGFAVLAHRRLRQSGMLAAIGASRRHVRFTMAATGATTAVAACVVGLPVGYAAWATIAAPLIERAEAHRVSRLALPWPVVLAGIVFAVTAATVAAWWPGRAVSRVPIVAALSARPPAPRPAHRSTSAGVACGGAGAAALAVGNQTNEVLVIGGTVAFLFGVVFVAPAAVRAVGRVSTRLPFAARLAVRDLARHQARSSAALAAVSLALTIVMGVVIGAAMGAPDEGNLPPDVIRIRGETPDAAIPAGGEDFVRRIAETVDGSVVELHHAVVRDQVEDGAGVPQHIALAEGGDLIEVHVATDAVLARYGLEVADIRPGVDVLTTRERLVRAELVTAGGSVAPSTGIPLSYQSVDLPSNTSMPTVLLTEGSVQRRGWQMEPVGWLVVAPRDVTADDADAAAAVASAGGLLIEVREGDPTVDLQIAALASGAALSFVILALTVGLIRAGAAADHRTLTAAGATRSVRRRISAATSASLALCGVVIGTLAAYAFAFAWLEDDLNAMSRVPWASLVAAVVGIPLAAAAGGWLFAGRQPPVIARRPIG